MVILDYQLPGVDGYQLFRELQALDAGVAVLVASGFLSNLEIACWPEAGVKGIIYKPFSLEGVAAADSGGPGAARRRLATTLVSLTPWKQKSTAPSAW